MTDLAEEIIKKFEGLKLKAYQDSAGVWTIGYGETKNVSPGMQISIDQADKYLKARLSVLEEEIQTLVKVPLNNNQLSALESFCYNLGIGAFAGSTMLRLINKEDFKGAVAEFHKWIYVKGKIIQGLVNRRDAEKKLFSTPTE